MDKERSQQFIESNLGILRLNVPALQGLQPYFEQHGVSPQDAIKLACVWVGMIAQASAKPDAEVISFVRDMPLLGILGMSITEAVTSGALPIDGLDVGARGGVQEQQGDTSAADKATDELLQSLMKRGTNGDASPRA